MCVSLSGASACFVVCFYWPFFAFLRVGEMTVSKGNSDHALRLSCLSTHPDSRHLKVTFSSFKHGKRPVTIVVEAQPDGRYCPVQAVKRYLQLRGSRPGYPFLSQSGQPVSRRDFTDQLGLHLKACNLPTSSYKSHSFRIGAATHAASRDLSQLQLRALGRWSSNAFLKYVRFN